jgi:uncharacterized protein (TIGR03382 family)
MQGVLADPEVPGDTGDTGDTGEIEDPWVDTDDPDDTGDSGDNSLDKDGGLFERNCDGCGGGPAGGWFALLGLVLLRRRANSQD